MSPSELSELFEKFSEQAIKLTLSSGDSIVLQRPGDVVIDSMSLHVITFRDPVRRLLDSWKVVSIPNIVLAEPFRGAPPPPRQRRK